MDASETGVDASETGMDDDEDDEVVNRLARDLSGLTSDSSLCTKAA
jgi:hypothetical protein